MNSPSYREVTERERAQAVREDNRVYEARVAGKLARKRKRYRLADAFSGAGGMTLGFSRAFGHAFDSVWAVDYDADSVATYNSNFSEHCVFGDIIEVLERERTSIPAVDVVIGGPPCQGFSLLNKNRDGDSRKQLWRPFLDLVELTGAKVFVMENVPQVLGSYEHGEIVGAAEALGFDVWSDKLCAADYGVPQVRWRAFIVGSRIGDPRPYFPPRTTHYNPNGKTRKQKPLFKNPDVGRMPGAKRWSTVRDAIGDLPAPRGTEIRDEAPPLDLHFGRNPTELSRARYRAIPKEGMNRFDLQRRVPELTPDCWKRKTSGGTDLFGRLWWDRPSVTIRTEFFKPEKGRYLHPKQHRPITHREAARIQSFPDDFVFTGSKTSIARQIGNAVPPLLAARVADVVYELLERGAKRGD